MRMIFIREIEKIFKIVPAQSITVTLHFYPLKNPSPTMQFTLVLCEFTGFQFVLPATHSCTLHYILHSECATVLLQQSREVQTGKIKISFAGHCGQ